MYYEFCPPFVTRESVLDDMTALPPGKTFEDKFYVGFFRENRLAAVMDVVFNYPDSHTAYIGFFMGLQIRKQLFRADILQGAPKKETLEKL